MVFGIWLIACATFYTTYYMLANVTCLLHNPGSEYTGYLNGDGITDTIVMTMCLQATNIRSADYLGFEGH